MHETRSVGPSDVLGLDIGRAAGAGDHIEATALVGSRGAETVKGIFHIGQDRAAADHGEVMERQEVQQHRRVLGGLEHQRSGLGDACVCKGHRDRFVHFRLIHRLNPRPIQRGQAVARLQGNVRTLVLGLEVAGHGGWQVVVRGEFFDRRCDRL